MLDAVISLVAEHRTAIAEVIGFIAGGVVLVSGLPPLWAQLRNPNAGTAAERQGHLLLAAGNGLWVVYALLLGVLAVGCMTGLNVVIRLAIWWQMMRMQRSTARQL